MKPAGKVVFQTCLLKKGMVLGTCGRFGNVSAKAIFDVSTCGLHGNVSAKAVGDPGTMPLGGYGQVSFGEEL